MLPNTKCGIFLSCLQFAILHSLYSEVILKPKQVICLEKVFLNLDILAILPTGYGKWLIYCLIPALLFTKKNGAKCTGDISSIVIIVLPLNALIENQISRLSSSGIWASVLGVKSVAKDDIDDSEQSRFVISIWSTKKSWRPDTTTLCLRTQNLLYRVPMAENWCTQPPTKKTFVPLW